MTWVVICRLRLGDEVAKDGAVFAIRESGGVSTPRSFGGDLARWHLKSVMALALTATISTSIGDIRDS